MGKQKVSRSHRAASTTDRAARAPSAVTFDDLVKKIFDINAEDGRLIFGRLSSFQVLCNLWQQAGQQLTPEDIEHAIDLARWSIAKHFPRAAEPPERQSG